ncbi:MAG: hypothetical protein GY953_56775 [bacterium]|nr:hypothetical protein [bacterium]
MQARIAHAIRAILLAALAVSAAAQPERFVPTGWSYSHARLKPVDLLAVTLSDTFWKPRIQTNINAGWADLEQKFDRHGHLEPFRIIAEKRREKGRTPNNDEFVYKWMEAGGYYAGHPSCGSACDRIATDLDRTIDLVLSIQRPDGYINSYFGNPLFPPAGKGPFDSENRFEFYNFGHLAQAAIALYRTTGDRKLLDPILRFADLIVDKFAAPNTLPYRLNRGPINLRNEHPNHELAMVELYRVTRKKEYLDFAEQTLDGYNFCSRYQIDGHAVQESLLNAGAADVYLEGGEQRFLDTTTRLWEDMVAGRMYLTGGIGSRREGESFGAKYELPEKGYAETCAAISSFFWSHRLLLATGDGRYGDLMERLMYNGILSGLSLSGTHFFYTNPMVSEGERTGVRKGAGGSAEAPRQPWYGTPCCPPNLARFLASLAGHLYATSPNGIWVNLYGAGEANVPFDGERVKITQNTQYPWEGSVKLIIAPASPKRFDLRLRVPSWALGRPVSSDLYRYSEEETQPVTVSVNGAAHEVSIENGFLSIGREWKAGDTVQLQLPMPVRRVLAHPAVLNLTKRVALERGPVVYCVEGVDHGGRALNLTLQEDAKLKAEHRPDLLGGVTVLRGGGLTAIPYAVWANRGVTEMAVWLPSR